MSASVSITLATHETAEEAVELLAQQLREHDIFTPQSALREVVHLVISDTRLGFILLARTGDQLAGVAYAAAHLSAEHGGIVGWLEELYVAAAWRSRGLGSALLHDVVERARSLNWRTVELEVVAGHERATPLYHRHGFRPLSRARFSRSIAAAGDSQPARG